jgi:hypothetical protein
VDEDGGSVPGGGGDPEIEAILDRIRALGGEADATNYAADLEAIRADLRRLEVDRRAVVEQLRKLNPEEGLP